MSLKSKAPVIGLIALVIVIAVSTWVITTLHPEKTRAKLVFVEPGKTAFSRDTSLEEDKYLLAEMGDAFGVVYACLDGSSQSFGREWDKVLDWRESVYGPKRERGEITRYEYFSISQAFYEAFKASNEQMESAKREAKRLPPAERESMERKLADICARSAATYDKFVLVK